MEDLASLHNKLNDFFFKDHVTQSFLVVADNKMKSNACLVLASEFSLETKKTFSPGQW